MSARKFTQIRFNHYDPEIMQDPYAVFAEVRSKCPLGHSDELGGFFFPTTYEGVKRAFSDFRTFTSTDGTGLPRQPLPLLPVDLDPPVHTAWRRTLNRFFTVEAAEADRERIQQVADTLIDAFIERGYADAVNELTRPFLAMSMLPVIGVPLEDRVELGNKLLWLVHNRVVDPEGGMKVYNEIGVYLTELAAKRRLAEQRDDLLQCLITQDFGGQKLDDGQVYQVLLLTLFGALDSTSSAMSGSLLHLARHPEDKARLVKGEVEWPVALDEFIRFTTPIQALRRMATKEVEIDGGTLYPGDQLLALNGAANRDPAKFPEPEKCILGRDATDHMSFGSGAHVCIGRHFARLMLGTCLKTMLARAYDFTVEDGFQPEYTPSEARAIKSLPIRFTPGNRVHAV